jgi:hypothetical protein
MCLWLTALHLLHTFTCACPRRPLNISSFPLHYTDHLEFLVNSSAQRRLIHHLHFCSHDDAPNTLGFHTFTLCSTTSTSNSVDCLSHRRIIWSSSQLSEWRRSSLRSSSVSDMNHTPFSGAFSQVCKLEKVPHSCNGQHLTGL